MSSLPDISVVMSVYNNADTLPAALDSILSQEGVELEFIVVNDGSTDGSGQILDAYAQRDGRLRVVHRENGGLTTALIAGCALARAPWIARQDADDLSLPGRLSALLALARLNPGAMLLASSAWYIGPDGERLLKMLCTPDNDLARRQILDLRQGPPAHGSVMFSASGYHLVGGYRPCFYYGQDSDLWMRLAEKGSVAYEPTPYYCYKLSPEAISGHRRAIQKQFGKVGQRCRHARRRGQSEEAFLRRAETLTRALRAGGVRGGEAWGRAASLYYIGSLLRGAEPAAARRYFAQAVRVNPLHVRAWVRLLALGWRPSR